MYLCRNVANMSLPQIGRDFGKRDHTTVMHAFKKIDKERAFDGVVEQILDNIQKGRLKKGDSLPAERVMAEEMGVSRPAIREALRALQLLGIITTIQGGANYISEDLEGCLIGPLSILFRMQKFLHP